MSALAGLTFRPSQKALVNLDYEGASSDNIYFRTSLNDYQKARARAQVPGSPARSPLQANFQVLEQSESRPQHPLRFPQPRQFAGGLLDAEGRQAHQRDGRVRPLDGAFHHQLPGLPFLSPATSNYRDNAHTATSAVDVALPGLVGGEADARRIAVHLDRKPADPATTSRWRGCRFPSGKHVYWNTEWQYYGFGEAVLPV